MDEEESRKVTEEKGDGSYAIGYGKQFIPVIPVIPDERRYAMLNETDQQVVRPLKHEDDKIVILTSVRMNPPTPGHMRVIEELINQAIIKGTTKVYVILSKTNDNKDDPIPCPEKINVLDEPLSSMDSMISSLKQKMIRDRIGKQENLEDINKIEQMNVIVRCVSADEPTPFHTIQNIINSHQPISEVDLVAVYGKDRADTVKNIKQQWQHKVRSIDSVILERENMEEYKEKAKDPEELDKLDMDNDVPQSAMSAGFVRAIVENKRFDKFQQLYAHWLNPEKIYRLYGLIEEGLTLPTKAEAERLKRLKREKTKMEAKMEAPDSNSKKSKTKKKGGKRKSSKKKKSKRKSKRKNTKKRDKKNAFPYKASLK